MRRMATGGLSQATPVANARRAACAVWLLLVAALLRATPAAATTLTRRPYLQLLTAQSVTVVWNTDTSAACALAIHPLGGATAVIPGPTSNVCAIAASDLSAGTQYAYAPLADGVALGPESVFRTNDPTSSFSFLVVGDSGCGCSAQLAVRDRMLGVTADFILHTGDMIYDNGEAANFDPRFFTPYAELIRRLVFWPCLGNHDIRTASGQPWRDAFYTPANNAAGAEQYYSFDFGNAHVAVLDSNASTSPGSAQYVFLDQDLGGSTALWKFVAFHHTIYSSSSHGSALAIRANLVPVFDRHGVDAVFMGHDHDYERTKPLRGDQVVAPGEGTVYITTGGGGKSLYAAGQSSFTAYAESAYHFTRVAVNGAALGIEMIRDDGAVRDTLSLTKPTPAPTPTITATPTGDHFTCYRIRATSGSVKFAGVPNPPGLSLVDQFAPSTIEVKKPKLLCAPTDTNSENPGAELHPEHLKGYQIKNLLKPVFPTGITVIDQFNPGGIKVDAKKQSHLLVPTVKSLTGPTPVPMPGAFTVDHFECYKVGVSKGASKFVPVLALPVKDQFGVMTVNVKKPRFLCNPVNKNGEGILDPVTHLMCYQVKQVDLVRFVKKVGVFVNNQFGSEQLDVRKPSELCVPATTTA
jgi:hypothetical protein